MDGEIGRKKRSLAALQSFSALQQTVAMMSQREKETPLTRGEREMHKGRDRHSA